MFCLLDIVDPDNIPDGYGRGIELDKFSMIIGFILGAILASLIAYFIFWIKSMKKDDNENDEE